MGMPISSYTVLRALVYGNSEYERPIALEALAPFNLFAFIIHDPETHQEFDCQLNRLFEKLDYITGEHLLFFALVDPPSRWMQDARRRTYFHKFDFWATNQLRDSSNSIKSNDPGNAAFSIARGLSIPTEMLPCLVITNDFRSNNFMWVRTSSRTVEHQLSELGFLASKISRRRSFDSFDDPSDLQQLRGHLAYEFDRGECSLEISMAKALSNILSFIVLSNKSNFMEQTYALTQVRETISELYLKINQLKSRFEEYQNEEFDNLCINIMELLSLINSRENLRIEDFIPIDRRFIEADTFRILRTAQRVFDLLTNNQLLKVIEIDHNDELDFTPGVVCLAKVFEKEMNLSIVHWLRKELGISLPEYFNKPQPAVSAVYTPKSPGGRPIDLNMNRNGKWLAPGIGQSEIACQDYSIRKPVEGWDEASWKLLLEKWKIIRQHRNDAAHTEPVTLQAALTVKDTLAYLAQNGYFENFYKLKMIYSGRAE